MVLNEDIVQSELMDTIGSLEARGGEDGAPATVTGLLEAAGMVSRALPAVKQKLVNEALDNGATWPEIATALGLKSSASAHWHYGPSRNTGSVSEARSERLRRLRERRPVAPKQELPGYSALALSKLPGWPDRRTIKAMGQRGEIRTVTVTTTAGKTVVRYDPDVDEQGTPVRPG